MTNLGESVRRMPVVSEFLSSRRNRSFAGSQDYWERRYASGGTSGSGSFGRLARFKADVLNDFVARNDVTSVIEFGCGDGNQLELARYPRYLGLDVAQSTLASCRRRFESDLTKSFILSCPATFADPARFLSADLALSIDVVYHLVEDGVFDTYMRELFSAAQRFVVVYSSDYDTGASGHVRHRAFTAWVARHQPEWVLTDRIANPYPYDDRDPEQTSFADFYFFARRAAADS